MPLKSSLAAVAALQYLILGLAASAPSRAADMPGYYFKTFTVTANCAEPHAGLVARVASGLKFRIAKDTDSAGGEFRLEAINAAHQQWAAHWNGLKLEFRPGTKMTTLPADFECIPGAESSSPFLAMSGFAQSAEPYYEQEHFYGLARIHGQLEHVLIFPRDTTGPGSAVIMLQSVNSADTMRLDEDGIIISEN